VDVIERVGATLDSDNCEDAGDDCVFERVDIELHTGSL